MGFTELLYRPELRHMLQSEARCAGECVKQEREKLINLPGVVTLLLLLLGGVQFIVAFGPQTVSGRLYDALAFIPARLSFYLSPAEVVAHLSDGTFDPGAAAQISLATAGGMAAAATLLSYAFLHGGWSHYFVNALTLAAFGAPIARRLGDSLFLLFLAGGAIAGALTHLLFHPFDIAPVVGASAAISGAMAGMVRFAFPAGGPTHLDFSQKRAPSEAETLPALARNRTAMGFVLVWFGSNALMGAFPQAFGATELIAWEAHIGGFLFGLVTFGFFDRLASRFRAI